MDTQSILDENDIEKRMLIVMALLSKEFEQLKLVQKKKEAFSKRIWENKNNLSDELSDLEKKFKEL